MHSLMAEIQEEAGQSPLVTLAAKFHDTAVWNVRTSSTHLVGTGYILAGAYLRQFIPPRWITELLMNYLRSGLDIKTIPEMEELENNTGASKPELSSDVIEAKPSDFDSEQTAAPVRSQHRESTYSTYLKAPRASRQSLQSMVTSPQHNPENNFYRQPGCRVFRRVSHLDHATGSLCRDSESPLSRSRGFLRNIRSRIRMPTLSLDHQEVSQKIKPRRSRVVVLFSSRALLFAEGRRDYSARRY
ncbi:hypothetical protein BDW72DRAFT_179787 [Aspergillus terricola var. indicus]